MAFGVFMRKYKIALAILGAAFFFSASHSEAHATERVVIYKNAYCMCCDKWADHLRKAGFEVEVVSMDDVGPLKDQLGIPYELWSCHTAKIGGYLVEGHVPADDILRVLAEKPDVLGISVPGMPVGSPGMEMPGQAPDPFASVIFTRDGETAIYAWH